MNQEKLVKSVVSLKNLSEEEEKYLCQMHEEIFQIHQKYLFGLQGIYDKRADIVSGRTVPDIAESEYADKLSKISEQLNTLNLNPTKKGNMTTNSQQQQASQGVPNFWANVFLNVPEFADLMNDIAFDILCYCTDLRYYHISPTMQHPQFPEFNENGYLVVMKFKQNPYFSNDVLFQYVAVTFKEMDGAYSSYTGIPLFCKGSTINWKYQITTSSKNNKSSKAVLQEADIQFFKMFTLTINPEEEDEEDSPLFGHLDTIMLFEDVISGAVDFFLNDVEEFEDEDSYQGGTSEDDEEDDDDDDDEEDEEEEEDDFDTRRRDFRRRDGGAHPQSGRNAKPSGIPPYNRH